MVTNGGERIVFRGKPALKGRCRFCYRIMIITDPDPKNNGSFETHHAAPACDEYHKRSVNGVPMGLAGITFINQSELEKKG